MAKIAVMVCVPIDTIQKAGKGMDRRWKWSSCLFQNEWLEEL
jgi:hypothetical protein